MNDEEKILGLCKWFCLRRGFGFIQGEDGLDYFIHETRVVDGYLEILNEGQMVKFYPSSSVKGPFALDIEIL